MRMWRMYLVSFGGSMARDFLIERDRDWRRVRRRP